MLVNVQVCSPGILKELHQRALPFMAPLHKLPHSKYPAGKMEAMLAEAASAAPLQTLCVPEPGSPVPAQAPAPDSGDVSAVNKSQYSETVAHSAAGCLPQNESAAAAPSDKSASVDETGIADTAAIQEAAPVAHSLASLAGADVAAVSHHQEVPPAQVQSTS